MRLETSYQKKIGKKKIANFVLDKIYLIVLPVAFLFGRGQLIRGIMPFGLPFYIALHQIEVNKIVAAVSILAGVITVGGKHKAYITAASIAIFSFVNLLTQVFGEIRNGKSKKDSNGTLTSQQDTSLKTTAGYAFMGLLSNLIPGLINIFKGGLLLYDLIIIILSSVIIFVLVFIFSNAVSLINKDLKTYMPSDEELISVVIMCALAFLGFNDIKIFGFNLKIIFYVLGVMILSFRYGATLGTVLGVTVGLVLTISSSGLPSALAPVLVGCFASCGLLSGIFRSLGKLGSGFGFLMGNLLFMVYIDGSIGDPIYFKEIILAICLLMIIPRKFILNNINFFSIGSDNNVERVNVSIRAKEMIVEKLNKFSVTFMEIAQTFREISTTKTLVHKHDISSMFDRIADRVCKDCSLCLYCWDRDFYSTYQVMFGIVEQLEQKGYIETGDIPQSFIDRCERINDFIQAVNSMYEVFKVEVMWKGKLEENRDLLSQQLEELSKAISGLALEIDDDVRFKTEIENTLLMMLKKEGIKAAEILAIENKHGRYEINICHKGCGGKQYCNTVIRDIVSKVANRKMIKEGYGCNTKISKGLCMLKFIEQDAYNITVGVAAIPKYDEFYDNCVSGDNYTFANNSDGKYILALSDGMGSGEKASIQSKATINLIEKFMESGFEKDVTVKLINSILALKSNDDYFSTIDLCLINLNDGEIEFMKIGAAPTFIKRKNSVDIIKTVSLPAGILSNMEIELVHRQLNNGDMIIQISDGVIDAFEDGEENKEKTFCQFIKEIKSLNPQTVADTVLDEAYKNSQGKPADDMTVIVAKFWKKAM